MSAVQLGMMPQTVSCWRDASPIPQCDLPDKGRHHLVKNADTRAARDAEPYATQMNSDEATGRL